MIHLGRYNYGDTAFELTMSEDYNVIVVNFVKDGTLREERTYLRLNKDHPMNNLSRNILAAGSGLR